MKDLTEDALAQFTGTEKYYKHWLGRGVYTEGVRYVAEQGGAYWLIDAIFSHQRSEEFQVWTLKKYGGESEDLLLKEALRAFWILSMREDSDQPDKVIQKIEFSDFPLPEIKFYLIDGVLMLTSEY